MKRALSEVSASSELDYYEITDQKDVIPAPAPVFHLVVHYILTKFSYYQRFEAVLNLYWTCKALRHNRRVIYILTTGDCNSRLVDRIQSYRPTFDWLFPGISPVKSSWWFKRLETFQWMWHINHMQLPTMYHGPSYREMTLQCRKTALTFPYVTEAKAKPKMQLSEAPQVGTPYEIYFWNSPHEAAALAFVYYCETQKVPMDFAISIPGNIWFVSAYSDRGPRKGSLIAVYREGIFLAQGGIEEIFDFFLSWGTPTDHSLWNDVQTRCSGTELERIGFFLQRWYAIPDTQLQEK